MSGTPEFEGYEKQDDVIKAIPFQGGVGSEKTWDLVSVQPPIRDEWTGKTKTGPAVKQYERKWTQDEMQAILKSLREAVSKIDNADVKKALSGIKDPEKEEGSFFPEEEKRKEAVEVETYPPSAHYYALPIMPVVSAPIPLNIFTGEDQDKVQIDKVRIFSKEWLRVVDTLRTMDLVTSSDVDSFFRNSSKVLLDELNVNIDPDTMESWGLWFPDPELSMQMVKEQYQNLKDDIRKAAQKKGMNNPFAPSNLDEFLKKRKTDPTVKLGGPKVVDFEMQIDGSAYVGLTPLIDKEKQLPEGQAELEKYPMKNILRHWKGYIQNMDGVATPRIGESSISYEVAPLNEFGWIPSEYYMALNFKYDLTPYVFMPTEQWVKLITYLAIAMKILQSSYTQYVDPKKGSYNKGISMTDETYEQQPETPASSYRIPKDLSQLSQLLSLPLLISVYTSNIETIVQDSDGNRWFAGLVELYPSVPKVYSIESSIKEGGAVTLDTILSQIFEYQELKKPENLFGMKIFMNIIPTAEVRNTMTASEQEKYIIETEINGYATKRFRSVTPLRFIRSAILYNFGPSSHQEGSMCKDEVEKSVWKWIVKNYPDLLRQSEVINKLQSFGESTHEAEERLKKEKEEEEGKGANVILDEKLKYETMFVGEGEGIKTLIEAADKAISLILSIYLFGEENRCPHLPYKMTTTLKPIKKVVSFDGMSVEQVDKVFIDAIEATRENLRTLHNMKTFGVRR